MKHASRTHKNRINILRVLPWHELRSYVPVPFREVEMTTSARISVKICFPFTMRTVFFNLFHCLSPLIIGKRSDYFWLIIFLRV